MKTRTMLAVAAALGLAAAAPVAAAPPKLTDRIGASSAASVMALSDQLAGSRVLSNSGTHAIVEARSAVADRHEHSVTARCPTGMRAMSAGFSAPSSRGEPPDFRVFLSMPDADGAGWTVFGAFDGSGGIDANGVSNAPTPFEWRLRVRLVCARL